MVGTCRHSAGSTPSPLAMVIVDPGSRWLPADAETRIRQPAQQSGSDLAIPAANPEGSAPYLPSSISPSSCSTAAVILSPRVPVKRITPLWSST